MTPQPAAALTDGILSMLITHMRPLSVVEDEGVLCALQKTNYVLLLHSSCNKHFRGVNLQRPHNSIMVQLSTILDSSQSLSSSMIYITAHSYCSSFKFPFYSENPSSNQTTAVYKIKAASFQSSNKTCFHLQHLSCLSIIEFSHGSLNIQHLLTLLLTPLSELDSRVDSTSSDLG